MYFASAYRNTMLHLKFDILKSSLGNGRLLHGQTNYLSCPGNTHSSFNMQRKLQEQTVNLTYSTSD